ncbi:MAG: hypothetical protein KAU50_08135 [Candidatus Marinimicrobia bacterium]|nr:hypothetical protein [Candidatus Neomarinimicrobiota bacterium]
MKYLIKNGILVILGILLISGCSIFRRGDKESPEDAEAVETEEVAGDMAGVDGEGTDEAVAVEGAAPPSVPAAPGGEGYVLNELNFEIKKLGAELKHQAAQLRELQAKSSIWANPLTIYNKEIILDNGTTFFGKIVYQDEKILKVETLIGYLIVERSSVVRIVENIPDESLDGATIGDDGAAAFTPAPQPANRVVTPSISAGQPAARPSKSSFSPNVVLVGTIQETKDRTGNLILAGKVKNIGGRRADFVKVNFVFRKDWSGNTKTLTSFVKGSFNTFESGITSDSSLLPGATATVQLPVPKSFGTFIGYSYTIEWEEY